MSVIVVKIDMNKVNDQYVFKGQKGDYLEIVLLSNKGGTDKYGNDYMAVQGVDQASRENGVKGPILGNARVMGKKGPKPADQREDRSTPAQGTGYRRRGAPPARVEADSDNTPFGEEPF